MNAKELLASPSALKRRDSGGPGWSPAFFTGTDPRILAQAPGEKHFHDKLGLAVLLLSGLSAACVTWTFSYVLDRSFLSAIWTGVLWLVLLVFAIERLVLSGVERSRWMLFGLIPRVALSVLIAIIFAESAILALNNGAITDKLIRTNVAKAKADRTSVNADFDPQVANRQHQIAAIRRNETALSNRIEANRFRAQCESGSPDCSYTGRSGNGAWYFHYRRQADAAQARLRATHGPDKARIATLNGEITDLKRAKAAKIAALEKGVSGNTDINARKQALAGLQKERPEINAMVWFLRLFFLVLDLLPLGVKVQRTLSGSSSYEAYAAAFRRDEQVQALNLDAKAQVEEHRIQNQMRADIETNRALINLESDAKIDAAMYGTSASAYGGSNGNYRGISFDDSYDNSFGRSADTATKRPALNLIEASNLDEYVKRITPHEAQRVTVPPDLRRGAFIGFALGAALAGLAAAMQALGHPLNGTWLVFTALVATAALAIYTSGFKRAPAWGLRAMFAALLASIAMPVLILLMNV